MVRPVLLLAPLADHGVLHLPLRLADGAPLAAGEPAAGAEVPVQLDLRRSVEVAPELVPDLRSEELDRVMHHDVHELLPGRLIVHIHVDADDVLRDLRVVPALGQLGQLTLERRGVLRGQREPHRLCLDLVDVHPRDLVQTDLLRVPDRDDVVGGLEQVDRGRHGCLLSRDCHCVRSG